MISLTPIARLPGQQTSLDSAQTCIGSAPSVPVYRKHTECVEADSYAPCDVTNSTSQLAATIETNLRFCSKHKDNQVWQEARNEKRAKYAVYMLYFLKIY